MSRTGENIYKRKDGRWEARYIKYYTENGKAKYGYLYAYTYKEVKNKLYLAIQGNIEGKNAIGTNEYQYIKYEYWLDAWLKSKKPQVKSSTYIRYKNIIENHIKPDLGKYHMNMISTSFMENFVTKNMTEGRIDGKGGLSPKSMSDIITVVKDTFKYAETYGIKTNCKFETIKIRRTNKEMRVLSRDEEKRFVSILLMDIDRYKLGMLISLYTGIRIGELCALKWKNISIHEKTIRIEQTMQRLQKEKEKDGAKTHIVISTPKSYSSLRTIPLPDFLVDILKPFVSNSNCFLLSGSCTKIIEPRIMQNRFKAIIQQGGIHDANYHSLRHTFATRCIEVGFDTKSLSEILGHSSVKITLDKYVHSSLEQKRLCMDKMYLNVF